MNRVIGFELKKLVSRPGIYILAIILAVLLAVSVFVYNPVENKTSPLTLNGATITEMNEDFNNNYKVTYNTTVTDGLAKANSIKTAQSLYVEEEIKSKQDDFIRLSNELCDIISLDGNVSAKLYDIHNVDDTGALDVLYSTIVTYIGEVDDDYYTITLTKHDFDSFVEIFTNAIGEFEGARNNSGYYNMLKTNYMTKYRTSIPDLISRFKYPDFTYVDTFLDDGKYYELTIERQLAITAEMDNIIAMVNDNPALEDNKDLINQFNSLFNEYRLTSELYYKYLDNSIKLSIADCYSNISNTDVKYYNSINYYVVKEDNVRLNYYMEHDKNELAYASPLTFDYASNANKNAYDYTHFTLSIFSIILVAFGIMLGAFSIAGEIKEGTMRFVAIRPVSRVKILFGKFMAIAIISFIMLLFSAVASMVVGGFTFGMQSSNILSIIDASKVLIIHPMLSLLIFVGSIYLQILVFISFAMLFSSFLKSDLLALILGLMLYAVNLMLPIFFGATSWLRFNPLSNINLYSYVGAGSIASDTVFGKIFASVVYSGNIIWLSVIYIVGFILILNTIAALLFKRREI